ncbi:hypothetical protein QP580_09680 [Prevotella bivia]|uniref:hypothetical protein n=1 Tax=Prevotella bivia TaxID=28125 RepID=UPI00254E089E|nr:hypothetical protein [Prevotella bivia]MDK7763689.1 hypothetical protein [Prevotella bivia]MDU5343055.1 hypothetical protein [Prevotella bivia]
MDYKGKQWKINGGVDVEWQRRNISRQHNSETVDYTVKATEYNPKFGAKWNNGKMDIDDILNRRRNLNRSVSGYRYHESFRPQIHSYALVSL